MTVIHFLTPTNLAEEKAKFFDSTTYNPQLRYLWDTDEAAQWLENDSTYLPFANALREQNTVEIHRIAGELFETSIEPDLLDLAQKFISQKPQIQPPRSMPQVVSAFESALHVVGLTDYSVEVVDQHGFNFRPSAPEKKISISKYLNLDFFSIDGEMKHELVHIIRYENGQFNSLPIARNYLPTEEGLATYCQDYTGENGKASLFQHAAEYAVTKIGLTSSFRNMTEYLQEIGFSRELAFQRAIRHKFGFCDTSQPGDIMKPSMYFYHEQKIRELADDEKLRLFVGKITIPQLAQISEYTGIIPKQSLIDLYQLSP